MIEDLLKYSALMKCRVEIRVSLEKLCAWLESAWPEAFDGRVSFRGENGLEHHSEKIV